MNKIIRKTNIKEKIKDFTNNKTIYEKLFDDINFLLISYQNINSPKNFIRDRAIKQFEDLNKNMILINNGIQRYSKESLNKKINNLKIIIENSFKESEKMTFLDTLEFAYACKNLYGKLNTH
ncbi:unnamed protein product [marine sediment metagenome]|uniref:Uncharacterized protein n=1 Tax=marine sediment metagenome TaxID=412755 RepID=X0UB17_9ZZZZ